MASKKSLRKDSYTFLIGYTLNQIVGIKLPYYLITGVIDSFLQHARIPVSAEQYCAIKLQKLYNEWRNLQKLHYRKTDTQLKKNKEFSIILDDLFGIAQADDLEVIKIKEDRDFVISQRQKGRPGSMLGIDLKIINKEKRAEERLKIVNERRKRTYEESEIHDTFVEMSTSSSTDESTMEDEEFYKSGPSTKCFKQPNRGKY
ncbi:hypothetical protein AGLY_015243 [Aphis glycines]|uniref:Uncharacterized protein n=1 Tax=Aphis glycines TaxID=307491 RepID=A0A6G0T1X8_APHGL|nr:hypothetical protein AGLY_015243 [Aphis glycines]